MNGRWITAAIIVAAAVLLITLSSRQSVESAQPLITVTAVADDGTISFSEGADAHLADVALPTVTETSSSCGAEIAMEQMRDLLVDAEVLVTRTDRGAVITVGGAGTDAAEQMIRIGWGTPQQVVGDIDRTHQLSAASDEARIAQIGWWSTCNPPAAF